MAVFTYNPNNLSLPPLPKITSGVTAQPSTINNKNLKNILDGFSKNITQPKAFTSSNSIQDQLFPTQELGNQFIQQNLLPEFQKNTFNPFQRNLANQAAGSNLSLLGASKNIINDKTNAVTRQFYDQAQGVQDQFNSSAFNNLGDVLKSYYDSQLNF